MSGDDKQPWLDEVQWDDQGLVPAIAQEADTGKILMVAWMNREALAETVASQRAVYWSRSRGRLWRKGEESGNVQLVRAIYIDCDCDTVLLKVEQVGGAACHEGYKSCFFRRVTPDGLETEGERIFDPAKVYGGQRAAHSGKIDPSRPPKTDSDLV